MADSKRPATPRERSLLWRGLQKFKMFALSTSSKEWDDIYRGFRSGTIPWESGEVSPSIRRLVNERLIHGRVLDVGCGLGTHSLWMAGQGLDVTGIDIAPTAIEQARRRALEQQIKVDFRVADALHLPFPDATFDAIIDRGTYHHQEHDKPAFVREVSRVLKPGGTYLLFAFSPAMHWPKSVSQAEVHERFGKFFEVTWFGDETHRQPDGLNVKLLVACLRRRV